MAASRLSASSAWQIEAGAAVEDVFARPALVGDDHRNARGLGFEHHVAEGVGGAGEDEEVGGGVDRGQGLALQISGKAARTAVQAGLHLCQIGPVSHHHQLDAGDPSADQALEGIGQQVQVLLPGDPSHIEELGCLRADGSCFLKMPFRLAGWKRSMSMPRG